MTGLQQLIQKYEDFERPNLDAQHAIWEVHSVKLMGVFLGLLLADLFPRILSLHWTYFAVGAAIFAAYPGAMAISRMVREPR
jgi:hypothetical protein